MPESLAGGRPAPRLPSSPFGPPPRPPRRDYSSLRAPGVEEGGSEGGPSGRVFPASAAAAGDGVRAVRWRRRRWWSSRELSLYSAPTGRPPSTSSTPSVKVAARPLCPRWPSSACVGRRRRSAAGLAGTGAADSLCVCMCVCEGGRAGGPRPLGASWSPGAPTPVRSPEASPASTRRLLTHGGLGARRESGPSRGPVAPQPCLPLWPVRAGPGPRAVPAGWRALSRAGLRTSS